MSAAGGDGDDNRAGATDGVVDRFHRVMGALDRSMIIVTATARDGERSGCLVGFSTQCSIDPARFLVCLSRANHTFRVARRADLLAVHVIPKEHDELAELFGGETGDEVDKFSRCAWRAGPEGVPILEDCPDWFVGRIIDRLDVGDHLAHLLDPIAVGLEPNPDVDRQVHLSDVIDDVSPGHEP